ncbi:MAG: hypothetical protein K0S70_185 [Microbacterium sp.]|jgi:hypothetical protein|nr:hypothetical protein [Microbacterium sp.]
MSTARDYLEAVQQRAKSSGALADVAQLLVDVEQNTERLVAALTAALDLHFKTDGLGIDLCAECRTVLWPCPTVRAVTDALTPKETDR